MMSTPRQHPGQHRIVIRGPHDVVAAVPCLLGFHPDDSLVAIGSDGPNGTCAVRMDLMPGAPPGPERAEPPPGKPPRPSTAGRREPSPEARAAEIADAAEHLAGVLSANGFRTALLIGYGPAERVAPMADEARAALTRAAIEVKDVLRVEGDRFWSALCDEPLCCPADGSRFDFRSSAVAARTVADGKVVLPDRAELARTVAPVGGPAREAMRRATDRAEARLLEWIREEAEPRAVRDRMIAEGLTLVRRLAGRVDDAAVRPPGGASGRAAAAPTDDEVAWLGVLLTDLRVRDEAWVRIAADRLDAHAAFWRTVLRRVDPAYAAAPGALLAYAAFSSGDGGLANVALDRSLQAQPGYSMAELLREAMMAGVPPARLLLRMTPDDLADACARTGPGEPGAEEPGVHGSGLEERGAAQGLEAEGPEAEEPGAEEPGAEGPGVEGTSADDPGADHGRGESVREARFTDRRRRSAPRSGPDGLAG